MPRLQNKIALVSGAARGIGAAIAQAFAHEGAPVIVTDINETGAHEVARALGLPASARRLDVREELAWAATMAQVLDTHGRLDVLVNNAGITGQEQGARHDPEYASLADWHAVHRTNLDGTFLGCKHVLRTMRRAAPRGSAARSSTSRCAQGSSASPVPRPMQAARRPCTTTARTSRCTAPRSG